MISKAFAPVLPTLAMAATVAAVCTAPVKAGLGTNSGPIVFAADLQPF